jgi:hypothetical protein
MTENFDRVPAKIQNKCPNCLIIELESQNLGNLKAALYLTINFYEQEELIVGGRVRFGLKRGELRLSLTNAKMKMKDRMLGAPLEMSVSKELTRESGQEFQQGGSLSMSEKGILPGVSLSSKTNEKFLEKETSVTYKVFTKGKAESPSWDFMEIASNTPLKGNCRDVLLGTLSIEQEGVWRARLVFDFSEGDVYINGSGGFWNDTIDRSRLAIIERLIVKHLLKDRLCSPMSDGFITARCRK